MAKMRRVKKTLNVDDELFEQAKLACGATTDTETVRLGLESLLRRAAHERLRALRGTKGCPPNGASPDGSFRHLSLNSIPCQPRAYAEELDRLLQLLGNANFARQILACQPLP
jgi:Arc/MetJ family transcription regulator